MKIYKNKANILAFFQMRSHRLHMESLISNLIFLKRSEDFWSFLPKLRSYIPQRFLQTIHTVQEAGIQLWSAIDKERPMSQESLQVPQNFHTFWRFSYSSSILLISGSHLTYSKMPENWCDHFDFYCRICCQKFWIIQIRKINNTKYDRSNNRSQTSQYYRKIHSW